MCWCHGRAKCRGDCDGCADRFNSGKTLGASSARAFDGSMEVVNIREGAARATDVMGWTGHVVREETDGVFDRGL